MRNNDGSNVTENWYAYRSLSPDPTTSTLKFESAGCADPDGLVNENVGTANDAADGAHANAAVATSFPISDLPISSLPPMTTMGHGQAIQASPASRTWPRWRAWSCWSGHSPS